jgi:hypothetical protein
MPSTGIWDFFTTAILASAIISHQFEFFTTFCLFLWFKGVTGQFPYYINYFIAIASSNLSEINTSGCVPKSTSVSSNK